ncbi:MAG: hypothetical protein ACRDZ3_17835 [Acidimicrobiia bacterium]
MPLRIGSSLGIAMGLFAGLLAGVAVSAGAAAPSTPPRTDYEIVRATFSASGEAADGIARCSDGKLVMGGGGRVLDEGARNYAIVASDPAGPSAWTATFVRHPESTSSSPTPGLPGRQEPEEPPETDFEVSAVCAAVR